MKISQLLENEHFDKSHKCKTPDAMFTTHMKDDKVSVSVKLPFKLDLSKDEMDKLEADLHYAVEDVLAKLFK